MSVLDEARAFEQRVTDRLTELEPLVREYHELKELKERLGTGVTQPTEPRQPRQPREPRAKASAGKRSSKAAPRRRKVKKLPPGERQQSVLDAIRATPGLTVRELGRQLDVDPTGLYRIVRRLETEGSVRREGAQAFPAG